MEHESVENRLPAIAKSGWSSFYFGSVAPDFQTLSGQAREVTHFYKLPPEPGNKAYPRLFKKYPKLARGDQLPINYAAFVAAYAAHLVLDLIWFREVLIPYFHEATDLGDIQQRRLLHLILLTYLDKLAFESLPNDAADTLSEANPDHWLPFAADSDLRSWQSFVAKQLQPGAISETVHIYAHRLQMTADTFAAKLEDEQWMCEHLFLKIPVLEVQQIVNSAVPRSLDVITSYLKGEFI